MNLFVIGFHVQPENGPSRVHAFHVESEKLRRPALLHSLPHQFREAFLPFRHFLGHRVFSPVNKRSALHPAESPPRQATTTPPTPGTPPSPPHPWADRSLPAGLAPTAPCPPLLPVRLRTSAPSPL